MNRRVLEEGMHWREQLQKHLEWSRRREGLGHDAISEGEKAYGAVLEGMLSLERAQWHVSHEVAGFARSWVETGNPYFIDAALFLCGHNRLAPPAALVALAVKAASARIKGEEKAGTAAQICKANAREWALSRMAKLCAAGATQELAASKVARWMADMDVSSVFKASTLEKYFTQEWQDISADMKECFDNDAEIFAHWKELLETLPEAGEALKGNRRD